MWKYFGGGALVVIVLLSGYYLFYGKGTLSHVAPQPSQPQQVATTTYATTTFSLIYPSDFSINDVYTYDQFGPKKLIHGVKFVIPGEMATGTNLASFDTGISVEQLPRAKNCTADIYLTTDVKAETWNDNGVEYSVASSSGAAAGNYYEEYIYALPGTHPCTAVRYFIHSTNIGNYPTSTVREFDRSALLIPFDEMRHSLVFRAQ